MKSKAKNAVLACIASLSALTASAQIRDGSYDGTMKCGPPLASPSQAGWSQAVKLQITGQSVLWERTSQRMSEAGTGSLHTGRVSLTLSGSWNPGEKSTGQWRTVTMLSLDGKVLAGPATIYSADGQQRLRDCTVRIAVVAAPGVSIAGAAIAVRPSPLVPTESSRPSTQSVQAAMQAALQIASAAKPAQSLPSIEPIRPATPPPSYAPATPDRAARERAEKREAERERVAAIDEAARQEARTLEIQRRQQVENDQQRREAEQREREERRVSEEQRRRLQEQERQRQLALKDRQDHQERDRAAEQAKLEASAKAAATRNTSKISALGLPSTFVGATLYANYMGKWTAIMPSNQWLGLLLENKKIAAVEAISVRGMPGVSIKRSGTPAIGILFRMEGAEAYVHALVLNGKVDPIESPADHSQMALMLKALTDAKNMD